jgi:hypothetical protein
MHLHSIARIHLAVNKNSLLCPSPSDGNIMIVSAGPRNVSKGRLAADGFTNSSLLTLVHVLKIQSSRWKKLKGAFSNFNIYLPLDAV